jgi:protein AroM
MSWKPEDHQTIGVVTIGQTPRRDIVPHLRSVLGDHIEIIEAGALDGLSEEEVATQAKRPEGACW